MTLRSIEIISEAGESLEIPLRDPSNGFFVKGVEGLDPVKAELVYTNFGMIDGAQFQSARREPRNIVMNLGIAPDYLMQSVASLRRSVYSIMAPKSKVQMKFVTDDPDPYRIDGYVESLASPIFAQNPELTVSVVCPNPDFVSDTPVVVNDHTVSGTTAVEVTYTGDIPAGFNFSMTLQEASTAFDIYVNNPNGASNRMRIRYAFQVGDVLQLTTIPGRKGIWVTRAGAKFSILQGLSPESPWPRFTPGVNTFRVQKTGTRRHYSFSFYPRVSGF